MTSGIEPATFRFVAQHLNHCATVVLGRVIVLLLFERRVLRKIFDSRKQRDVRWRIKTNDELDELIRHIRI